MTPEEIETFECDDYTEWWGYSEVPPREFRKEWLYALSKE